MPQRPLSPSRSLDLPDVLLHMTGRRGTLSPRVPETIAALPAWDRLASILLLGGIYYSTPFGTPWPVACFTQTTRRALYGLPYLHFGLAFHKQTIWDAGGGPVHYVRGDQWTAWENSDLPAPMKSMGVRLWPGWQGPPPVGVGPYYVDLQRPQSEWLHEREWRLPLVDFANWGWAFPREAVAFLICAGENGRNMVLNTLSAWGGDRAWAEALPWAQPDDDLHTIVGGDTALWP